MDRKTDKIILSDKNLSDYFYGCLSDVNKQSNCPLPQEFILYSSEVMDKYALSEKLFINENEERLLGMELLQAEQKSVSEKKELYKEIGDLVLFQLGVFPKRVTKKAPSRGYYLKIGKSAYSKAAKLDCSFYDIPNFYNLLSTSLENLVKILAYASESFSHQTFQQYLIENDVALSDFNLNNKKVAN